MNSPLQLKPDQRKSVSLDTPSRVLSLPNLENAKHKRSASFSGDIGSQSLLKHKLDWSKEKVLLQDTLTKTNPYSCRKSKRYFVLTDQRIMYFQHERAFKQNQSFKVRKLHWQKSFSLDNTQFEWSSSSISIMSFILSSTGKTQKTKKRKIIFNSETQGREWNKMINKLKKYEIKRSRSLPCQRLHPNRYKPIGPQCSQPLKLEVEPDDSPLKSINQESKEESSSSPEPLHRGMAQKRASCASSSKMKGSVGTVKEQEREESKTPHFHLDVSKGQDSESEVYFASMSRNKKGPKSKGGSSFPLQLSNIMKDTLSDGFQSLKYLELHSTIERGTREPPSENVKDSDYEGIMEAPQEFCTISFFYFFELLKEYSLKVSKEDLHSIVNSLKKSGSRNGLNSGIESLRSSLDMIHEKFKAPTEASTRRDPEPGLIQMEDGTLLCVEQNSQTQDKTLKVVRGGSRQTKQSLSQQQSLYQVDEDEEQVIEWKEYLSNLLELGNDIILVHYSEKMIDRIIESSISDPENNRLNTSCPQCVFSRMQENLRCVNNYNNRETNDVLWVNMQIFLRLTQRQAVLGSRVLDMSRCYFDKSKKLDLDAREYHLSGLLVNDIDLTYDLLVNYADAFLRLRSDSGNYSFLHSFLEEYFCRKFVNHVKPEDIHIEARQWIGTIIFKPQMVDYLLDCINDQLAGYYVIQKKLSYLRLICEKQLSELVPVLGMSFQNVDELIAEAETRFKKKKALSDKFIL